MALLTDRYLTSNGAVGLFADVPTATWYEPASKWRTPALYQNAMAQTNRALAREPLNIINYVVRNNLPFTEVLSSDYTVVNPFSACALGVQGRVTFKSTVTCSPNDPAYDPYDFQKVPTAALGGALTTRAYLNAHSTTETNRNRHRVSHTVKSFLGVDILSFSKNRLMPDAGSAASNPTMTNAQCTVCHAFMDPMAGTFQNYDPTGKMITKAWYTDVFAPGYMGEAMPAGTPPLVWSAKKMASDPRFARHTVNVVYTFLTGAPLVALSSDPNVTADPANWRTYALQEAQLQQWTDDFIASGYKVSSIIKEIVADPMFSVQGVQGDPNTVDGRVVQGLVGQRVMTPQSLNGRITGTLGSAWSDGTTPYLLGAFYSFYGGIDSLSVTSGVRDFSTVMSSISLRMASQMACSSVPHALSGDTSAAAVQARATLFPKFDLATNNSEAAIKQNLQQLHFALLGEDVAVDSPEVQASFAFYQELKQALVTAGRTTLPAACAVNTQLDGTAIATRLTADANGSIQAWMGVVAAMLADLKFLTE